MNNTLVQELMRALRKRRTLREHSAKAGGTKLGSARPGHWEGREQARLAGARSSALAAAKARELRQPTKPTADPDDSEGRVTMLVGQR